MTTAACQQTFGTIPLHGYCNNSGLQTELGNASVKLIPKGYKAEANSSRRGGCSSRSILNVIHVSSSQTSVAGPVSSPISKNTGDFKDKSNEAALILIRHAESLWNEMNLFTGCVDVPLTKKGVEEAIEAGRKISNIPVDLIYTSALIRSQMTAMLAMTQHRCKKVPIIMHNDNEQARAWSEVFSEETRKQSIPVIAAWQLNERMYGELQGFNKQETAVRYGKDQVHAWRRSYRVSPPNDRTPIAIWEECDGCCPCEFLEGYY